MLRLNYIERYIVELEDGTFALWGQFVEGESLSIMAMSDFCSATLFHREAAERKVGQINQGVWKFLGDPKAAIGVRKIEMKMI